ncbi:MAG: glycerol kinase, partial [Candidatus Eremiobacteraeota bacterium]|nr:glycerol kinase [Candidatus Eremiobacteraeota bacterium]
ASSADVEKLAREVPGTEGVFFVPAFTGLGAPYWDASARAALLGVTRGTTRAHIARAVLEAMAYQSADVIEAMQKDAGIHLQELRVDGGASANDTAMQFQADLLGTPVLRPHVRETTALGAAYLAGLYAGYWRDPAQIASLWKHERRFEPRSDEAHRRTLMTAWHRAVERTRNWISE